MTSRKRNRDKLDDAVSYFTNPSSSTKVCGNLCLQLALEELTQASLSMGLKSEHIIKLLDVAGCGRFADTINKKLIRCLIPSTTVPIKAVLKAISWMCTNKPSMNVQSLLVRWMLVMFDHIDDKKDLHALYGILFYFVESNTLMPHVCHLLYLLTRKEDVRMFRVRILLNLQTRVGVQPYITGLLSIYKLYYPNLVSIILSKRQRVFFRSRDRIWSAAVRKVQESNAPSSHRLPYESIDTSRLQHDNSASKSSLVAPKSKRRRLELIPEVNMRLFNGRNDECREKVETSIDKSRIPFVQVKTLASLAESIERVELPSQIATVLKNQLLQSLVACSDNPVIGARLSYWLHHRLSEDIINCSKPDYERNEKLLQSLMIFTNFIQEGIPVVDTFLSRFLCTWDGRQYRTPILALISRCRMYPFEVLNFILEPLRILFFTSTVYFKCQVIMVLTDLLRNYSAVEWPRYKSTLQCQRENSERTAPGKSDRKNVQSLFVEEVEMFQPLQTIIELVNFVDKICIVGLELEKDNILLLHFVMDFFELVVQLFPRFGVPLLLLPSSSLLMKMLFGNSALICSRLCAVTCSYKEVFPSLKAAIKGESIEYIGGNGLGKISQFNSLVLDISNCLWRFKAFQSTEKTIAFKIDKRHVDNLNISFVNERFSIYLHQAFMGFTVRFIQETQPKNKKVHPVMMKRFRDVFVEYLKREHLDGIFQFIDSFIRRPSASKSQIDPSS